MKKSLLLVGVIVLAAFALSGCGQVIGLVFQPNLYVDNIEPLIYSNEFAAVNITFGNDGVWQNDVGYQVVLSPDPNIDPSDFNVYEDWFSISFNGTEQTTVQAAYLNLSGVPDGDYFIGVIVDPWDDIDESDERDNSATSYDPVTIGAGGGGGGVVLYPDPFEPNDNFYQFSTLNPGWNQVNLHTDVDEDWFEIYQPMNMPLTIETRPGADGAPINVYVEVYYNYDEYNQVYWSGPSTNNYIYIPMEPAIENYWRVRVYSPTNEIGEYEITAYN